MCEGARLGRWSYPCEGVDFSCVGGDLGVWIAWILRVLVGDLGVWRRGITVGGGAGVWT